MKNPSNKQRIAWIVSGAAALGAGFGIANVASAASSDSSTTVAAPAATNTTPPADQAGRPDPASLPNGPGETVLTGSDLAGVTAAVKSIDPTGTIIRAETDTDGHTFEAHVKQADGSVKTYYFTSTFQADGSTDGFRPGGAGGPHDGPHGDRQGPPPAGQAPQGQAPAASSPPTTAA
jgi:hypothetical protein